MATLQAATTSTGALVTNSQAVRKLCEDHCFGTLNWEVDDDVRVGEKAADGAKVQRWYDCPDCGYEAPSRIVHGAER